ncbi:hypothetical protein [Methyloprofundus sp.]
MNKQNQIKRTLSLSSNIEYIKQLLEGKGFKLVGHRKNQRAGTPGPA